MFGNNKELIKKIDQYTDQYTEILIGLHADLNAYKREVDKYLNIIKNLSGYSDDQLLQLSRAIALADTLNDKIKQSENRINSVEASLKKYQKDYNKTILELDIYKRNSIKRNKELKEILTEFSKSKEFLIGKIENNSHEINNKFEDLNVKMIKEILDLKTSINIMSDDLKKGIKEALNLSKSNDSKLYDLKGRMNELNEIHIKKADVFENQIIQLQKDNEKYISRLNIVVVFLIICIAALAFLTYLFYGH